MKRLALALAALAAAVIAGLSAASLGSAQTDDERVFFVLATGSTGGTYFPIGQTIAAVVSHPPGAQRCDQPGVCGPPGLVATVRSSAGSVANILDVNAGRAGGGLAQSDIIAEAIAGRGDFRKAGAQSHVRVLAALFPEEVHVVAATAAHIAKIGDLRGKRVDLGAPESGTASTSRAILAAYRIGERALKPSYDSPDVAAQRLERGEIDAFFFVGGAPVEFVRSLIGTGKAALVPIDGVGRDRLLKEEPGLTADSIPASDYGGASVDTVSVHAVLIVNDQVSADVVYGMTKALFNPANRGQLDSAHPRARLIRLDTAAKTLPAPLHPGAARYYRETGAPIGTPPRT